MAVQRMQRTSPLATRVSSFDELSPYWRFLENGGLNENLSVLVEYVASPVLLLGSGQGLVSQKLVARGYDVTNVDISRSMIGYAKSRRGVETIEADAASVSISRKFRTIIISTGLVTEANAQTRFVVELLTNVDRHLACGGQVLLTYLKTSSSVQVFEYLGLLGRPSNNFDIWNARASLDKMKECLSAKGYDNNLIDYLFVLFEDKLEDHRQMIERIGSEYMKINGGAEPPQKLIDACADFASCYLKPVSEHSLIKAIEERYGILVQLGLDDKVKAIVYARR
jgi:SAM-dependent methyltransferase